MRESSGKVHISQSHDPGKFAQAVVLLQDLQAMTQTTMAETEQRWKVPYHGADLCT